MGDRKRSSVSTPIILWPVSKILSQLQLEHRGIGELSDDNGDSMARYDRKLPKIRRPSPSRLLWVRKVPAPTKIYISTGAPG